MNLAGTYSIPTSTSTVWQGMNDPALLKRCIHVCESFERVSEALFVAVLRFKLGPLKVRFTIDITIAEANPPQSYHLLAEGRGGLAGLGRGRAEVALTPEDETHTQLAFTAEATFEGTVARLAGRIMEGTAMRYADEFFSAFSHEVSAAVY
jgi:carbon monoxide dehydrogenase subunit G